MINRNTVKTRFTEYVEHYEAWRNLACAACGAILIAVFSARQIAKKKALKAG